MTGPIDNPDPWSRLSAGWRSVFAADLLDSTPPPKPPDLAEMVEAMRDARAVISEHQAGRTGCPHCGGYGYTLRLSPEDYEALVRRGERTAAEAFTSPPLTCSTDLRVLVDGCVPRGRAVQATCRCAWPTPPGG